VAVLPDVRWRPGRWRGRARIAAFRLVSGAPALAVRCPQCRQQVSAATWDRTRPSTAVNGMSPGSGPADPAARADAVAVMFSDWWAYLAAPVAGGVAAVALYDRFLRGGSAPA
jgi:hypothetical protein